MKKCFLLVAVCCLYTFASDAKIWRVNNNIGINADFNNLNTAVNASNVLAGDTVQVENSANGYGGVSLSKRLVILGGGYFLSETAPMVANPKTQATTNVSYVDYIDMYPGSKNAVVSGMQIGGAITLRDSFLTVQRCYIGGAIYFTSGGYLAHGDTFRQNYCTSYMYAYGSGTSTGLMVYNNIFTYGAIDFSPNPSNVNGYFINNNFASNNQSYNPTNMACTNFTFQNNIFSYVNFGGYQSSNIFFNNLCAGTGIPTGNSNVQNVTLTDVYNDFNGNGAGYSSDGRFQLKGGSPALAAGVLNGGAVDCGAFGGPAPYILSGMNAQPSIYSLTVPSQVSTGTPSINISISSASH